jgi:hypothetical protein
MLGTKKWTKKGHLVQCSGSVRFWASRIRILIRNYLSGSRSGSFHQQAKKMKKNLDFNSFVTSH